MKNAELAVEKCRCSTSSTDGMTNVAHGGGVDDIDDVDSGEGADLIGWLVAADCAFYRGYFSLIVTLRTVQQVNSGTA